MEVETEQGLDSEGNGGSKKKRCLCCPRSSEVIQGPGKFKSKIKTRFRRSTWQRCGAHWMDPCEHTWEAPTTTAPTALKSSDENFSIWMKLVYLEVGRRS